jgi:neutral trehalase
MYTVINCQRGDNIVTNEEANYTMSDPGNFLPPAVKKQIKARLHSGNPFTVEELNALVSSVLQERSQKDKKEIVKREEIHKKCRKSLPPSASALALASAYPLPLPPRSSSKEESKPLSSSVAEGMASLEETTKVEPQANSRDKATSKKKEIEEGEPATKKPRVELFVQCQSNQDELQQQHDEKINRAVQKKSDNAVQKQINEAFQKELDEAKPTLFKQNESLSSDEAALQWTS